MDICGPSVPHMLGLDGKDVHQSDQGSESDTKLMLIDKYIIAFEIDYLSSV